MMNSMMNSMWEVGLKMVHSFFALSEKVGKGDSLLSLDEALDGRRMAGQNYVGLQDVAIEQIVGSVNSGRCQDFDASFCLQNERGRGRWNAVAKARRSVKGVPPVVLVQLGSVYFVQDGHHRISVARACGDVSVRAHVTVLVVAGVWERNGVLV
ncbi:MAG: hypothetical protein D6706_12545 [Chloroflexi bacterium]|nr:MAG: hypothetical protein D6706_12545 [Chloroflexota bacterium]